LRKDRLTAPTLLLPAPSFVMAGPDPAIYRGKVLEEMSGSGPVMTLWQYLRIPHRALEKIHE
jgi:hypothetical protein